MIRLRTLGETGIWREDGRVIGSLLEKPKAFAVLVYLTCHPEREFHQRDSLLPVFWPDSDTVSSRNCLRQTLHVLRVCLGDGVVISRGRSLVGVHPEKLDCDVRSFTSAVVAGRLEDAAVLYRGAFLEGFSVNGRCEFDQWAELRQRQLQQKAIGAVRSLAQRAEAEGDHDGAVRWWSRGHELAPFDEAMAIGLIAALWRSGSQAEAVRLCERYVESREGGLGLPPSGDFRGAIEDLMGPSAATIAWRARSRQPPDPPGRASALGSRRAWLRSEREPAG